MTDSQVPTTLGFCRWTLHGLRAAALIVVLSPLAAWCSPLLGLPALAPVFATLAWEARLAGVLASLPAMLVWLGVIAQWIAVFQRFATGAFLEEDIARRIRRAGGLTVLAVPARVLTTALSGVAIGLGQPGQGSLQLSIGSADVFIILTGLICLAIGRVWSEAARVHDEWRHTV
jgi:hypothetical protein